jgi:phosphoglycolate phosphatase-like HAD superfamily hydrolase
VPSFAVFDIDGVLADVRHRLHHLRARPKNWHGFFSDAANDTLLDEGARRAHEAAATHAIVYLSGRPEGMRRLTQAWLDRYGLPVGGLVLRPNRDRRPARVLKPELLARVGRQGSIAQVVDDDSEVVAALRDLGYPVVHATWAGESRVLHDAQEKQGRS